MVRRSWKKRRRKEPTYLELSGARGRARLVVFAATVGRRLSAQLRGLAVFKSEGTPEFLRKRVNLTWLRRWRNFLACGAAKVFALSLLERRMTVGAGCTPPSVDEVVSVDSFFLYSFVTFHSSLTNEIRNVAPVCAVAASLTLRQSGGGV